MQRKEQWSGTILCSEEKQRPELKIDFRSRLV